MKIFKTFTAILIGLTLIVMIIFMFLNNLNMVEILLLIMLGEYAILVLPFRFIEEIKGV